jgi:hypothetical protein
MASGLALGAGAPALGDTVHLQNGQTIEGRVRDRGEFVEIEVPSGRLTIPRASVRKIDRKPLTIDEFNQRRAALPAGQPSAIRDLADWARSHGLEDQGHALDIEAARIEVEHHLRQVSPVGAEEIFGVAIWAREAGYPREVVAEVLGRVVALEPDHAAARDLLRHERYEGRWRPSVEVRRLEREAHIRTLQAQGYVELNGAWVSPETAAALLELEKVREERAALREELSAMRDEREASNRRLELELTAMREQDRLELERLRLEIERLRAELRCRPRGFTQVIVPRRVGTQPLTPVPGPRVPPSPRPTTAPPPQIGR